MPALRFRPCDKKSGIGIFYFCAAAFHFFRILGDMADNCKNAGSSAVPDKVAVLPRMTVELSNWNGCSTIAAWEMSFYGSMLRAFPIFFH